MRSRLGLLSLCLAGMLSAPVASLATTYKVDPDHTTVAFRIRHLFSTVTGRFDRFAGQITFDPNQPDQAKVEGTIEAASINTNVEQRDKHLRSADFFDVEKFPKISFTASGATDVDAAKTGGKLKGLLTIHGVEKPVVLDVTFLGEGKDPWGNQRAGFSAKTTVNRKDFGLTWNKALETGGVLVGDEVKIEIDAEAVALQ